MIDMHVSRDEEDSLLIEEEETKRWRAQNEVPGSDDIETLREELQKTVPAGNKTHKRDRALSAAVSGPRSKQLRK